MASCRDRDTWSHIFKLYKGFPHLWDKHNKNYGNRNMMTDGYKILTRVYIDKLDKQATVGALRMKMKNIRTTYYRELKKVKKAKQEGRSYTPTLWYFENMNFLSDTHMSDCITKTAENKSSEDTIQIKDCIPEENIQLQLEENNIEINANSTSPHGMMSKKTKPCYKNKPSFLIEQKNNDNVTTHSKISIKDEHWEVIGKSIGYQLRELSAKQFTVVSKLISDAIFFGRLNKLSESSHIELGLSAFDDSASSKSIHTLSGHYGSGFREKDLPMNLVENITVKDEQYNLDDYLLTT